MRSLYSGYLRAIQKISATYVVQGKGLKPLQLLLLLLLLYWIPKIETLGYDLYFGIHFVFNSCFGITLASIIDR